MSLQTLSNSFHSSAVATSFNASALAAQIGMWWHPIILIGEVSGFAILVFAFVRMARMGARNDQGGMGAVAMSALAGVLLLSLAASVSSVSMSFFGATATSSLSYANSSASGSSALEVLGYTIVRIVGLVGFIRGLWYLKQSGDDPSVLGHAFTRILGGVLAMHFHTVMSILESSGL